MIPRPARIRSHRARPGTRAVLVLVLASLALFLPLRYAVAGGFLINEQGAKASAMAAAFTAQADDPAAIFYNPAGIIHLSGTQVSLGAGAVIPHSTFESDGNPLMGTVPGQRDHLKDRAGIFPTGYITRKVNDRVSVGLGIYSPFGLATEWPSDSEGRFALGGLKSALQTISISPVVAFRPASKLSFGLGPYFQYIDVDVRNLVLVAPPAPPLAPGRNAAVTAESKLTGNDWAAGWTAGFLWQPIDSLSFGASYLSEVRHDVRGRQEVTSLVDAASTRVQSAASRTVMPATLRFGAAWKCSPWTAEFDAQWTEWSSFRRVRVDLASGASINLPKNWHNSWTLRIGGQYRWNEYLDLRAGFARDESPIPRSTLDPMIPSGNRNLYCAGVGIHLKPLTIDVAYNYIQDADRRWNNPSGDVRVGSTTVTRATGSFVDTAAHLVVVNLLYAF